MRNPNINSDILINSIFRGTLAFLILISIYFLILTLISGWNFTLEQFTQFWYYIISLALGFGIQLSLYSYLRGVAKQQASKGQLVATGTTSTTAMISCCAHYLTNILPILGVTGIITFISQYQVQFFWVGLAFNLFGIIYIGNKVVKITGIQISKAAIFYGGLLLVVLVAFLLNNISVNTNAKGTDGSNRTSSLAMPVDVNNQETKESNEGPIAVSVTPNSLDSSSAAWSFEISLTTHSGSIDDDLVSVSELIDDQGRSFKPISWEGSPPGGHHRSGFLIFKPISPQPKSIELKIKNVGGVSERRFKWNL